MILPISIEYEYYKRPYATAGLILTNVVIFMALLKSDLEAVSGILLWPDTFAPWQWWTSGFLHAGYMHIVGNMLFLWVYGRYLEERLGSARFIILYMTLLPIASLAFIFANFGNSIPAVGASGAISGLMGLVMAVASSSRVNTVIWYGSYFRIVPIVAGLILALWVIEQLAMATFGAPGIAVSAHLGGFAGGFLIGMALRSSDLKDSQWYLNPKSQSREDLDARLKSKYYDYLSDYHRGARNGPVGRNEIPEWIKSPKKEEPIRDPYWEEQIRRWNESDAPKK
ncbi:rhomboid family intramembrane serine protease [Planctomycetota bacterium]|nr:rhomboid family intramembrane serine protease [Planctomycetota bacterium]